MLASLILIFWNVVITLKCLTRQVSWILSTAHFQFLRAWTPHYKWKYYRRFCEQLLVVLQVWILLLLKWPYIKNLGYNLICQQLLHLSLGVFVCRNSKEMNHAFLPLKYIVLNKLFFSVCMYVCIWVCARACTLMHVRRHECGDQRTVLGISSLNKGFGGSNLSCQACKASVFSCWTISPTLK